MHCIIELSLPCLIKLSFWRAFIITNSLQYWPYNYFPYCPFTLTKPPSFFNSSTSSYSSFLAWVGRHWVQKKFMETAGHNSRGGQRPSSSSWLDLIRQRVIPNFSIQHGLPVVGVSSICETDWERRWNSITGSDRNKWEKSGNLIKVILDFSLHFVTDGNCFWS